MSLRWQATFQGAGGAPYYTRFSFAGTTQTNAQDAADAARAFWLALQGHIADTVILTPDPEVLIINDITGQPEGFFTVSGDPISFTASNTMLPRAAQGLVRWRTGVFSNGREIRGHTFIPCLTEVANGIGVPTTSIIGTVGTAAAALIADTDSQLGVYSKANGTLAVVTSGTMWNEWASLRSRRD